MTCDYCLVDGCERCEPMKAWTKGEELDLTKRLSERLHQDLDKYQDAPEATVLKARRVQNAIKEWVEHLDMTYGTKEK